MKQVDQGKGEKSAPLHSRSEYPATIQPKGKQDAAHKGQPVGKLVVNKQVENEIAKSDSVERFESLGVDVVLGEAKFYSKSKIVVGEKYFKFRKCRCKS